MAAQPARVLGAGPGVPRRRRRDRRCGDPARGHGDPAGPTSAGARPHRGDRRCGRPAGRRCRDAGARSSGDRPERARRPWPARSAQPAPARRVHVAVRLAGAGRRRRGDQHQSGAHGGGMAPSPRLPRPPRHGRARRAPGGVPRRGRRAVPSATGRPRHRPRRRRIDAPPVGAGGARRDRGRDRAWAPIDRGRRDPAPRRRPARGRCPPRRRARPPRTARPRVASRTGPGARRARRRSHGRERPRPGGDDRPAAASTSTRAPRAPPSVGARPATARRHGSSRSTVARSPQQLVLRRTAAGGTLEWSDRATEVAALGAAASGRPPGPQGVVVGRRRRCARASVPRDGPGSRTALPIWVTPLSAGRWRPSSGGCSLTCIGGRWFRPAWPSRPARSRRAEPRWRGGCDGCTPRVWRRTWPWRSPDGSPPTCPTTAPPRCCCGATPDRTTCSPTTAARSPPCSTGSWPWPATRASTSARRAGRVSATSTATRSPRPTSPRVACSLIHPCWPGSTYWRASVARPCCSTACAPRSTTAPATPMSWRWRRRWCRRTYVRGARLAWADDVGGVAVGDDVAPAHLHPTAAEHDRVLGPLPRHRRAPGNRRPAPPPPGQDRRRAPAHRSRRRDGR